MAWEKWQFTAAEMAAQKRALAAALTRLIKSAVSIRREKEMLDKALRRFLHAKMFAAWNMWRSWAAEMRRQKYVMAGAVKRMLMRQLSMAFEKWQFEAAAMAREK